MNKVFSRLKGGIDGWVNEERSEDFVVDDFKNLGEDDTRDYFSFNPATVTIPDQDEKFDVKFYDVTKPEDKEFLASRVHVLPYLRQDLQDIKGKLLRDVDLVDVLMGLGTSDKYIISKLTDLKKEFDDYLTKTGF